MDGLDVNDAEVEQRLVELATAEDEIDLRRAQLKRAKETECSDKAFAAAVHAGRSFNGGSTNASFISADPYTMEVRVATKDRETKGFSYGPLYAQMSKCRDLTEELRTADAIQFAKDEAELYAKRLAVLELNAVLNDQERVTALVNLRVAAARVRAALSGAMAATNSAQSQITASLTQVQQAVGELSGSLMEFGQAKVKTDNAMASANLERDLTQSDLEARFGIQRKFRSYDMWRARALIESARRLSVAARRATEARFIVNLSELDTPQAFVDSPSIWADEVYSTDLDAPSVVGLSVAPKLENAIYPNKLLDYVGNLERFVKGYTVTYPTSVAGPDTEVVTLPGPDITKALERSVVGDEGGDEVEVPVLSPEAQGWTFYCPGTNAWREHPGVGQVPLADRASTVCDGEAPTRMRYSFALDPWGRRDGSIGNRPLAQRHNVRWRQLAVNLIGTGIRDCGIAGNSDQCFSESFLRYQLTHAGPAWATNHAQQWRAYDIPSAFIEDGKALTSEEWLDPIANSWHMPFVASVARAELAGRPVHGAYELIVELSPEVRIDRIQQVQLLIETDYWVRQQ